MRNILLTGIFAMLPVSPAVAYEIPGADAPNGAEVHIVMVAETGALKYQGGIPDLADTSKIIRKRKKNAGADPDVRAYRAHLDDVLDTYRTRFEAALGRSLTPLLRYTVRQVGMAVLLTESEAQDLKNMPGVTEVRKDQLYELDTDAGPQWIGAEAIWSGTGTPDSMANFGEGVVVGVLDTGVNMDHPSFSDSPEDGHIYVNPFGAGNFIGDCDATFVCNDKLIGVYDFVDAFTTENDGPEDGNGHGSHTASTAAGNFISGPFTDGGSGNPFDAPGISGVARHANLITYDVCFNNCPGMALLAGIDQALLDGVDVINYSISGGNNPWNDLDRGFLDLVANGTVVNASAGNTSQPIPDPVGNVAHRGPWVNTVANQTHNRVNSNAVSAVGGPAELQDMYGLLGVLDAFGGMDVTEIGVYAGNIGDGGNFEGCLAWTGQYAADFTDRVLLVSRGSCDFADKINFADDANAAAVLVFNNQSVLPTVMGGIGGTTIPSLMIGQTDGENLRDHISDNLDTIMVTMSGTAERTLIDNAGSFINPSSLRGPNEDFDVTKPDIGGPGTNVFAAFSDAFEPNPYAFLTGTSMSSPHAAGASALLKSIHPDWTPPEIKSALMMTARRGFDEAGNPATPDHEGSGTINLGKAALAGLVMHETLDNFLAADPAEGGDPGTLNLPSMRANDCNGTCEWTRTVCSALDSDSDWAINTPSPGGYVVTASPDNFSLLLPPSEALHKDGFEDLVSPASTCQTFTVSVEVTEGALVAAGELIFDEITLSESAAQSPDLRMTITFLPTGVAP